MIYITWSSFIFNDVSDLKKRISNALLKIDSEVEARTHLERSDLLDGLGGISMYHLNRFHLTRDAKHEEKALGLLDRVLVEIGQQQLPSFISLGIPTAAPCWLIDQFIQREFLDLEERTNTKPIIEYIIEQTQNYELANNFHDLFYGFIGKGILLLENQKEDNKSYIHTLIDIIRSNSIRTENGSYWNTPSTFFPSDDFQKTINYGIPHGTCGIILFLLKCADVYHLNSQLRELLRSSIDWLIYQLDKENNNLKYSYSPLEASATGKLGWCYGDQTLAFTLLRYYETYNYPRALAKAWELIRQSSIKPIDQTGLKFYSKYGYYDMRVCHGTSSVAYMWKRMFDITRDYRLEDLANKWVTLTLDNLDIFLPQLEIISSLEKDNEAIDFSMGFINGLSGVGLVLMSFVDPKLSDWDKLLLLDRPGRE